MRNIKDTEAAIGAGRLSSAERRKIFDTFLNAGGEVISERKKRNSEVPDREKYAAQQMKKKAEQKTAVPGSHSAGSVKKTAWTQKNRLGFFQNLRIRFSLLWLNVVSSGKFHPDFILVINHQLKSSLFSFYMLYMEIFEKRKKRSENVSAELNSRSPLYFNLIKMAGELYPEFYSENTSFERTVSLYRMKNFLTGLYRKLFLLYPYRNILNEGISSLYDAVQNMYGDVIPEQLEKDKIIKNLIFVFYVFYKKLHWLVCSYEKIYFRPDQFPEMEKFLEIKPEEKPENRKCETVFKIKEEESAEKEDEQNQSEEKEQGRDERLAAGGSEIMNSLNMHELRGKYDSKKIFELVPDDDSVLISFILFGYLINEFSCIFDTGKIRFDGTVYIGSLIYPECMRDLYFETGKMDENFADYADTASTCEKMKGEKPSGGGDLYFAYSRRIQEIIVRKERSSTFLRLSLKSFLERIMAVLMPLIDSMDNGGNDVLNADEVMQAEGEIIRGKTVRESVITAAMYVSAFIKRLSTEGDLFDYNRTVSVKKEEPVHKAVEKDLELEYVMNMSEEKDDDTRSVFEQIDDIVF